jgi:hypothetical protein
LEHLTFFLEEYDERDNLRTMAETLKHTAETRIRRKAK